MCKYLDKSICCLTLKKCQEKEKDNCPLKQYVNNDKKGEDIYNIRQDITCKNCGKKLAYQYKGKLYQYGLPKDIIDRCPKIYGKYYNKTYLSSAVGFGGTIPYTCCGCGKEGLIGISMETYENLFEENKDT